MSVLLVYHSFTSTWCAKSSMVLVLTWLFMHAHVSPSLATWYTSCLRQFANKSPSMCSLFIPFICTMSHPCTCICDCSWRDDIKSINLPVYHDAPYFIFGCRWPGWRTRFWNYVENILGWDAGSVALSRKIMQRSLGGWDEQSGIAVTICGIWLD